MLIYSNYIVYQDHTFVLVADSECHEFRQTQGHLGLYTQLSNNQPHDPSALPAVVNNSCY